MTTSGPLNNQVLEDAELGFRISFPVEPAKEQHRVEDSSGVVELTLYQAVLEDTDYMIGVAVFPAALLSDGDTMLENGQRAALARARHATNISATDLSDLIPDVSCRRVTYEDTLENGEQMSVELRLYLSRNRLYTLGVFGTSNQSDGSKTAVFFSSFELLGLEQLEEEVDPDTIESIDEI
jgi:hypothetical protein